jgi:hypothetical protein
MSEPQHLDVLAEKFAAAVAGPDLTSPPADPDHADDGMMVFHTIAHRAMVTGVPESRRGDAPPRPPVRRWRRALARFLDPSS